LQEGKPISRFKPQDGFKKHRINYQIRVEKVRVIDSEGKQLGIMSPADGIRIAQEQGLDLIEIAPEAKPPVAKILDFGKFKYLEKKKEAQARKKQTTITVKEIKFSPTTETHDVEFKLKHIMRFLEEGNRVKLTVFFRGRQMAFKEKGFELLNRVMGRLENIAKPDGVAAFEGKRLILNISPAQAGKPKKKESGVLNHGKEETKVKVSSA
jgi:translation initiation factor IF-3